MSFSPTRAASAPVWTAPSISSSARLQLHGAPIYVRHEVVHNKYVVDDLRAKGAVFVEELAEVPEGATVVFSAHGVSQAIRREAQARKLRVFDATCPLVTKVHVEVAKMHDGWREIIMIGHAGHPEVEGTMGQVDGQHVPGRIGRGSRAATGQGPGKSCFRHPDHTVGGRCARHYRGAAAAISRLSSGPRKDDICYATQNRQDAVKAMAARCDVVIVVGSPEQFQLQPVARGGGQSRRSCLHAGQCRRI